MSENPFQTGVSTPPASQDRFAEKSLGQHAHDLRSPLASIRTGIEVLKLSKANPEQVEKVAAMLERQTLELARLIDEMVEKDPTPTIAPELAGPPSTPGEDEAWNFEVHERKVLLVEDSRSAVEILSLFFKMEGFAVETANTGEEAVALAKESESCVVFLDIGLPDMNGYEVAKELRKLPHGNEFFLVALTGRNEEEDRIKIKQAGFDLHVVKPPAPAILRDVLQVAGKSRREARQELALLPGVS